VTAYAAPAKLTAAGDEPMAPKQSTQDLNRLSVKQMTDDQLRQARDELPKRAGPIEKEIKLRGLTEPDAKAEVKPDAEPEVKTDKSQVIQDYIDGKRDAAPTLDEIRAEQEDKGQTIASDADAAHLFGKDQSSTAPTPDSPIKPLSEIRVVVDVKNADSNKTTRMSVAASVAMRDVSDRINALEDLIACMER